MRIFNIFISILIVFQVSSVQAIEPVDDQQVMLYYEIPFGDNNLQTNQHRFGLRYDRTMQEPRGFTDFSSVTRKPAVIDLQFKHKKPFALKIHGIDYTDRLYIQQADAGGKTAVETETETEAAVEGDTSEVTETAAEETSANEVEPEVAEVAETAEEPEKKDEKTVVQKKLDSLPFGVVIGVLLGIGILAGVGG